MHRHHFFKGEFFDFEVVRILGTCPYGGADVAEVLEAVGQIKDGDPVSWQKAWHIQAERAKTLAEKARKSGDRVAARNAYLRASNYTRASGYMLTGDGPNRPDPSLKTICRQVNTLFRKAAQLLDCVVHYLDIPYQHVDGNQYTLPAHLYLPPSSSRLPGKIPLLISSGGADALQEELFYMHPSAGPGLGYAVLTFEGPGQGITLRERGLKMRPDWEVVVGAVLDYTESFARQNPSLDLDLDRVTIAGASLGGYFALRAACDPRIKACVALDPLYSMWDFAMAHVSPTFVGAWSAGWLTNGTVDAVIRTLMRLSFQMRWDVSIAGTFFGIESPAEIMLEMKRYSLALPDDKCFLGRVKCPVLVSGAAESLYLDANNHTVRVHNGLVNQKESMGEKQLWMASTPGEGALQAKMGALRLANQRTFAFLDQALGIKRGSLLE